MDISKWPTEKKLNRIIYVKKLPNWWNLIRKNNSFYVRNMVTCVQKYVGVLNFLEFDKELDKYYIKYIIVDSNFNFLYEFTAGD